MQGMSGLFKLIIKQYNCTLPCDINRSYNMINRKNYRYIVIAISFYKKYNYYYFSIT